jgi:putative membrane protein
VLALLTNALVGLIAAAHLWFLALEMFLWEKPLGLKVFAQSAEQARTTAVLAANQGLYNGFLAAGLIWAVLAPPALGQPLKLFFLGCVVVAGAYGGYSAKPTIFFVQAVPALVALGLVLAGGR